MPTCSALMHTDRVSRTSYLVSRTRNASRGFTLTESIVVVLIVSLFVLMAMTNLFGLLGKNTFKAQRSEEHTSELQSH